MASFNNVSYMDLFAETVNYYNPQEHQLWEATSEGNAGSNENMNNFDFQLSNMARQYLFPEEFDTENRVRQFIIQNAGTLLNPSTPSSSNRSVESNFLEDLFQVMPSPETIPLDDGETRIEYFFKTIKPGDLLMTSIVNKVQTGFMLKVLCLFGYDMSVSCYLADLDVKAFCSISNIIPGVDSNGVNRIYAINDKLCCEIVKILDSRKIFCSMKDRERGPNEPKLPMRLGLLSSDDVPLAYKNIVSYKNRSDEIILENSVDLGDPCTLTNLEQALSVEAHWPMIQNLWYNFDEEKYTEILGRWSEAILQAEESLELDPTNVDGLVARGSFYTNTGEFEQAINDLSVAVNINPSHEHARMCLGESLFTAAQRFEESGQNEQASKYYQDCLNVVPYDEKAWNSWSCFEEKIKNAVDPHQSTFTTADVVEPVPEKSQADIDYEMKVNQFLAEVSENTSKKMDENSTVQPKLAEPCNGLNGYSKRFDESWTDLQDLDSRLNNYYAMLNNVKRSKEVLQHNVFSIGEAKPCTITTATSTNDQPPKLTPKSNFDIEVDKFLMKTKLAKPVSITKRAPVVLDKFGSFRLMVSKDTKKTSKDLPDSPKRYPVRELSRRRHSRSRYHSRKSQSSHRYLRDRNRSYSRHRQCNGRRRQTSYHKNVHQRSAAKFRDEKRKPRSTREERRLKENRSESENKRRSKK